MFPDIGRRFPRHYAQAFDLLGEVTARSREKR
jgi:hypothetical protein